jgi:cytochrome c oxidase subunit 3
VLGAVFLVNEVLEWASLDFGFSSSAFSTIFYLLTGFHGLHVLGGLVAFVFLLVRSTFGPFTPGQATAAIVVSYYWHFVDIVWIGLFTVIYLIR